jgi:hypothetical protein
LTDPSSDAVEDLMAALERRLPVLSERTARRLASHAVRGVRAAYSRPREQRPAAVARELKRFAKATTRLANHAERLSEDSWFWVFVLASRSADFDQDRVRGHVAYLQRLSRAAEESAREAGGEAESAQDSKGGRTPDPRYDKVVRALAEGWRTYMGREPTHVVDPSSGDPVSEFDFYCQTVFSKLVPEGEEIHWRALDAAIAPLIAFDKSVEEFTPPLLDEN